MTVKQLKELLVDAPDDMTVYVNKENALGGFMFAPTCPDISGVAKFGPPDHGQGEHGEETEGFVILAHGEGITEDEAEDQMPDNLN